MKSVYYHYTAWEDFQSGMYNEVKEGREERIQKALELLRSESLCREYMSRVTSEWRIACEQTFTNRHNPKSFLGQCACFLYGGVRDNETRIAWGLLTEEERYRANAVADEVYKEWRREYEKRIEH